MSERRVVLDDNARILQENAIALRFNSILLNGLLVGITIAISQSWSNTILSLTLLIDVGEEWSNVISSIIVSFAGIFIAIISAISLKAPRTIMYECKNGVVRATKKIKRKRPVPPDTR